MEISTEQIKALNKIWSIYGNNGFRHTHGNHRFIQNLIEHGEDSRNDYPDLSKQCEDNVDAILYGDFEYLNYANEDTLCCGAAFRHECTKSKCPVGGIPSRS